MAKSTAMGCIWFLACLLLLQTACASVERQLGETDLAAEGIQAADIQAAMRDLTSEDSKVDFMKDVASEAAKVDFELLSVDAQGTRYRMDKEEIFIPGYNPFPLIYNPFPIPHFEFQPFPKHVAFPPLPIIIHPFAFLPPLSSVSLPPLPHFSLPPLPHLSLPPLPQVSLPPWTHVSLPPLPHVPLLPLPPLPHVSFPPLPNVGSIPIPFVTFPPLPHALPLPPAYHLPTLPPFPSITLGPSPQPRPITFPFIPSVFPPPLRT